MNIKHTGFERLSDEELKGRLPITKVVTGVSAGAILCLFSLTLYNTITDKFTPLLIVPIALFPILMINLMNISKIKAEMKSREIR